MLVSILGSSILWFNNGEHTNVKVHRTRCLKNFSKQTSSLWLLTVREKGKGKWKLMYDFWIPQMESKFIACS